jgi:hypothetical protein
MLPAIEFKEQISDTSINRMKPKACRDEVHARRESSEAGEIANRASYARR